MLLWNRLRLFGVGIRFLFSVCPLVPRLYVLHIRLSRICRNGTFLVVFFLEVGVASEPVADSRARFLLSSHTGRIEEPGRAIDHEFLIVLSGSATDCPARRLADSAGLGAGAD